MNRCPRKAVAALAVALLLTGSAGARAAGDAGFVASWDTAPDGSQRVRALGPFFEFREATNGARFLAVRPFYCRVAEPGRERVLREYLWPLAMDKEFLNQSYWRVLLAYGHDFDASAPDSRYRAALLPLLFAGRDKDGRRYGAVFPLGGEIREFMGFDKVGFALFPLYEYSALNDLQSWSVLWPLISATRGEGVSRRRVFPFYGVSRRDGEWTKRFVLWPLWTSVRYEYPRSQGSGYILFPLFGHVKLTDQESWMLLPPLFRWSRGETLTKAHGPWPFVQYSEGTQRGKGATDKLYLWPIWGRRETDQARSWFALWPIVGGSAARQPGRENRRLRVLPILQTETDRRWEAPPAGTNPPPAAATNITARHVKVWPLVSYERERDLSLLRVPDLSPFRNLRPVERNLAPLWTLYSQTRAAGGAESELLWGLYRHRRERDNGASLSVFPLWSAWRGPDGSRAGGWSVLKGLAGRTREGDAASWRLLYFLRIGGGAPERAPAAPPEAPSAAPVAD